MRNTEISELRYLGASAAVATVISGLVLVLALCASATKSWWGTGTELDDAPMRVVGFMIVFSLPIFFYYLVVFYLSSRVLALVRWLSFGSLAMVSFALAYIVSLGFGGWGIPQPGEMQLFAIFWLAVALFTLLATYIWWRVAFNRRSR